MDRIKELEKYCHPSHFAYLDRTDNNGLTIYEFERQGGGRHLKFVEWNVEKINSLSEEEFISIIQRLEIERKLDEIYGGLSLFDFLKLFDENTRTNSE